MGPSTNFIFIHENYEISFGHETRIIGIRFELIRGCVIAVTAYLQLEREHLDDDAGEVHCQRADEVHLHHAVTLGSVLRTKRI